MGSSFSGLKGNERSRTRCLVVTTTVSKSMTSQENFSITLMEAPSELVMMFAWDHVVVPVTMKVN